MDLKKRLRYVKRFVVCVLMQTACGRISYLVPEENLANPLAML